MEFGINAYTDSAFKYDQWSHSQMLHYFFFVTDYAQKDMPFLKTQKSKILASSKWS